MNGLVSDHPHVKIAEQPVEGFGAHAERARITAEGGHDEPAFIGDEAPAADAVAARVHGGGRVQVS